MTRSQQLVLNNEEYRCQPSKEQYKFILGDKVPADPLVEESKDMHFKSNRVTDLDHHLQTGLNDRSAYPGEQDHTHHDQVADCDVDPEIDLVEFYLFSLFQVIFRNVFVFIHMLHQFIIVLLFESKHSSTYIFIYPYLYTFIYQQSKQRDQIHNP